MIDVRNAFILKMQLIFDIFLQKKSFTVHIFYKSLTCRSLIKTKVNHKLFINKTLYKSYPRNPFFTFLDLIVFLKFF